MSNKRYLLIHGFGVGVQYSVFAKAHNDNCGFLAFDQMLRSGQAKAFNWRISKKFNILQTLNPLNSLQHYFQERSKSKQMQYHDQLDKIMKEYQPDTVVCHSMGCLFLLNFLERNTLSKSVTEIIFSQADIDKQHVIPLNLQALFEKNEVNLINYYCFWDNALLSSSIVNFSIRSGQVGWWPKNQNGKIANKFYPLYPIKGNFNLHTSGIINDELKIINSI
jgi:Serine hydrolase